MVQSVQSQNQNNKVVAVYFCNWTVYRNCFPSNLPKNITHVLYAFAKIDPKGTVSLSDPWADLEKPMPTGEKGALNELHILKNNTNLRVLLSIGGWTYRESLDKAFATETSRREFARSAAEIVRLYSLDGIDVDWEYPETKEQSIQYVQVLAELRNELGDQFELSVAAPADPNRIEILNVKDMDQHLSFWNIMAYDFAGSWSQKPGYLANLRSGSFSCERAIEAYANAGVPYSKQVLGMPLYARSFLGSSEFAPQNPIEDPNCPNVCGVLPGPFEAGVHPLCDLPVRTPEVCNDGCGAFRVKGRELVVYDNASTVKCKALYALNKGLRGGMFWEASGDPDNVLVESFVEVFGGGKVK